MEKGTVIILLVLLTFLAALGVGFYQLYAVDRAKKTGSKSAMASRDASPSKPG